MPFLMLYRQAFELQLQNFIRYLAGVRRCRVEASHRNPDLTHEAIEKRLRYIFGHNLRALLDDLLKHYNALISENRFLRP